MRSPFKRLLSLGLCFALVLILLPVPQADAAENDPLKYLSYTISNGEVTLTDCDTSITGALVIPDTIEGLPVTAIGDRAFDSCHHLTQITLGNYIITIGNRAFALCYDLAQITLGNHVTTIGNHAFYYCSDLTQITLGDHVTTIDQEAFSMCPLTQITIPASVTSIGKQGLDGITTLETVVFLGDPPQFHKYAFGEYDRDPTPDDDIFEFLWKSFFTATVYYPIHNPKWTSDVMQRYGAKRVTWEGYHSRDKGTPIIPVTCTTDGSHSYTCTVCGENEIVTIPALGHSWDKGTPITAATCTAEGTTGYVCGTCSEIKLETTPALGHSWDKGTVTAQPTCTQDGVRLYTCTTCSATYEEAITATGHSWDKGTVTSQPTCTQEGVRQYTCETCSATYEEAITPTGHTWGDTVVVGTPNCLEAVTVDHICATCGTVGNRQTLTAPGHSYESTVQPATCTQPGQIIYTCKTCGDTRSTETSPATGHQYESGTCTLCGTPLTGDINGDNTVDIADVSRLYAHVRNTAPLEEPQLQNADTTGDGVIDIVDVARLYAHVKGTRRPLLILGYG